MFAWRFRQMENTWQQASLEGYPQTNKPRSLRRRLADEGAVSVVVALLEQVPIETSYDVFRVGKDPLKAAVDNAVGSIGGDVLGKVASGVSRGISKVITSKAVSNFSRAVADGVGNAVPVQKWTGEVKNAIVDFGQRIKAKVWGSVGPARVSLDADSLAALRATGLDDAAIQRHIDTLGDIYVFRGSTEGFVGNPVLQRLGISPTSIDPVVATTFAAEGASRGANPVVMSLLPEQLRQLFCNASTSKFSAWVRSVRLGIIPHLCSDISK